MILDRTTKSRAPILSPDLLVKDTPHRPYFVDLIAASPSKLRNTAHTEAAQCAHTQKLAHYWSHHEYSADVFYPLSFERSGYLHSSFDDFIRLYVQSAIQEIILSVMPSKFTLPLLTLLRSPLPLFFILPAPPLIYLVH
jgi:hypothetical protein